MNFKPNILSKEKIYEEIGENYRFFLRWRDLLFAGHFIITGALLSFTYTVFNANEHIAWLISLLGAPLGFLFRELDKRNRELYNQAIKAGASLEKISEGFYSMIQKDKDKRKIKGIHTRIIEGIYIATSLVFIIITLVLLLTSI